MTVLVAFIVGYLAGRTCWLALRPLLFNDLFERENYRHHTLPVAGGLVLVMAALLVEGLRSVVAAAGVGSTPTVGPFRAITLLAAFGFGLLGLLDDLAGSMHAKGFRGHLGSLGRGSFTTGALKLFGGGALALVLASAAGGLGGAEPGLAGITRLGVDAVVIALVANLANLLDRAPGRAVKAGLVGFVILAATAALVSTTGTDDLVRLGGVAVVMGASGAVLLDDLRERIMLGDTGANVIGACLGLGIVMTTAPGIRVIAAVALVALNVVSEFVSFSSVIDAVGPLRALDRMGTRPERSGHVTRPVQTVPNGRDGH